MINLAYSMKPTAVSLMWLSNDSLANVTILIHLLSCAVVKEHCVVGPTPSVLMNDKLQV